MSREINPFGLRMPPSLRATLEESARAAGRSMNSEILHRLMSGEPVLSADQVKRQIFIDGILEALGDAEVWWGDSDPMEHETRTMNDALDEAFSWYRRLQRLDNK